MRRCVVFLTLFAVSACMDGRDRFQPLQVGDRVPEYGARALSGDSVDLAEYRGRPLLVNVWATWCAPCREEMPALQELADRYQGRLDVVGVSIDQAGSTGRVQRFLEEVGVDFRILLDPQERFVRRFRTLGVPESFLVDHEGVVRRRWIGSFDPLAAGSVAAVEEVIAEAAAGGE